MVLTGETEVLGEKFIPLPLFSLCEQNNSAWDDKRLRRGDTPVITGITRISGHRK